MKISISMEHGVAAGLSYEQSAQEMRRAGFEGVDLSLCRHQDEPELYLTDEWLKDVDMMAEAALNAGLELAQCHLPYYPGHLENPGDGGIDAFMERMLPMYTHALRAAGAVGCRVAVMHPFALLGDKQRTLEGNVTLIKALLPLLEAQELYLALENVFLRRNHCYVPAFVEEAGTLVEIIDRCGSARVGACLDTGHANIFRFNIDEMAVQLGRRLIALHINSNAGHDEHSIPYGISGWCERMDFEGFTRALKRIGYKGWYNLEVMGGHFPANVAPLFYRYAAGMAGYLAGVE